MKSELPGNAVCVWSEGVDECVDVLDDRKAAGVCEFAAELSCKSV